MTNITSEYATLPRRLGVNDMGTRVREVADHSESRRVYRIRHGSGLREIRYALGHKTENIALRTLASSELPS